MPNLHKKLFLVILPLILFYAIQYAIWHPPLTKSDLELRQTLANVTEVTVISRRHPTDFRQAYGDFFLSKALLVFKGENSQKFVNLLRVRNSSSSPQWYPGANPRRNLPDHILFVFRCRDKSTYFFTLTGRSLSQPYCVLCEPHSSNGGVVEIQTCTYLYLKELLKPYNVYNG